jgi:type IV pilus assembly protein PilE
MNQHGFTIVEVLATCAIAGVLAGVALPAWNGQILKARRADATSALGRLQAAQERYRAAHGRYAADLAALRVGSSSDDGLYAVALQLTGPDAYRASAAAVAGRPQAADAECARLVLDVSSGFATAGPTARCWNR